MANIDDAEIVSRLKKLKNVEKLFSEYTLEEKVKAIAKATDIKQRENKNNLEQKMKNISDQYKELEISKELIKKEKNANLERIEQNLRDAGYTFTKNGKLSGIHSKDLPSSKRTNDVASQVDLLNQDGYNNAQSAKNSSIKNDKNTSEQSYNVQDNLSTKNKEKNTSIQDESVKTKSSMQDKDNLRTQVHSNAIPSIYPNLNAIEPKQDKDNPRTQVHSNAIEPKEHEKKRTTAISIKKDISSKQAINQDTTENKYSGKQHSLAESKKKKNDAPLLKQQKQSQQQRNTQEPQNKDNLFIRLYKAILKMFDNFIDKKDNVEYMNNKKVEVQRNTLINDKAQGKNMSQASFIEINEKKFDLEPGKNFSYNDKAINIILIYTNINMIYINHSHPETTQQKDLSPTAMQLSINGKGYSIPYGENFSYKSDNLKISVTHGHQQEKDYDKILNTVQDICKNLREYIQPNDSKNNVLPMGTINAGSVERKNTEHSRF